MLAGHPSSGPCKPVRSTSIPLHGKSIDAEPETKSRLLELSDDLLSIRGKLSEFLQATFLFLFFLLLFYLFVRSILSSSIFPGNYWFSRGGVSH